MHMIHRYDWKHLGTEPQAILYQLDPDTKKIARKQEKKYKII